jgi:hypothetical protein
MSALWKQCQQGSSNEGWAKYIQAAALALGFPSETRFTTPLADATEHDPDDSTGKTSFKRKTSFDALLVGLDGGVRDTVVS